MEFMDKLRVRVPNSEDMRLIRSWYPDRTELDFTDTVGNAIIVKAGEILGYGGIKLWSEAMIAMNPELSRITRARVYSRLLEVGKRFCLESHLNRLHASPDSAGYGEILKKLGFIEATQPVLALEIH